MPITLRTTKHESRNIGRGDEQNPLSKLHRMPDLAYVVSVVLSLLAILFAFDSICGEKEAGTLRLIMSNSVPRDSILLAKWLGGYLVLIVPFLIASVGEYDKANGFGEKWWQSIDWSQIDTASRGYKRRIYELECERKAHLARIAEHHKIAERFAGQMNAQIKLTRWLGRISPYGCFAMASAELADVGVIADQRYFSQLREHRTVLCNYAVDEWQGTYTRRLARGVTQSGLWNKVRSGPVPVFNYVQPLARDYLSAMVVDGGILAGMLVVLFMLTYVTFLRYDVR